jgi:hypothetical protein
MRKRYGQFQIDSLPDFPHRPYTKVPQRIAILRYTDASRMTMEDEPKSTNLELPKTQGALTTIKKFVVTRRNLIIDLLSVLGLLLAWKQYFDSSVQGKQIEEAAKLLDAQNKELLKIGGTLSTRPLALFPKDIPSIREVLADPDDRVRIMCDMAAYGHFSAPDEFEPYLDLLRKIIHQGKAVDILIFAPVDYRRLMSSMIKDEKDFEEIKKRDSFRDYFVKFFPGLQPQMPKNRESFIDFLCDRGAAQTDLMLQSGVKISIVPDRTALPYFLWIKDRTEAVVSLYNPDDFAETPFRTRDSALVGAAESVFESAKRQSVQLSRKDLALYQRVTQ